MTDGVKYENLKIRSYSHEIKEEHQDFLVVVLNHANIFIT